MSIKVKLVILFLSIALIPLVFVSALAFHNYRQSLESRQVLVLQNIADFKTDKIESFFSQKKAELEVLRNTYTVRNFLPVLAGQAANSADPALVDAKKIVDGLLQKAQTELRVLDIILVDSSGMVIYSSNPLHAAKEFLTPLSNIHPKVFNEAKKGSYITEIFLDKAQQSHSPAALIAAPVQDYNQGAFSGLIVFEVDMQPIYALIQKIGGLGNTGETLIGRKEGDQVLFLNPLKYDPQASFNRKIKLGDKFGFGIQEAVQGRSGAGSFVDYRGENALGAWRYIPSLDLGVVVKMDAREAFADVINLRNLLFIILFIVFCVSAIMAVIIAQLIAGPIKKLTKGTEEIISGNLDYQVGIEQKDEIGQLSRAFDRMTLEQKKAQDSLRMASQYSRTLIEVSLDPLMTIAIDGKITDVNEATIRVTGLSRRELIGTEFAAYFTEPQKAESGYRKVFSEGFVTDYPLTIRHKDGHLTDVLYNASVYKDTQGNILGVFAAARNVTTLKQAEAELRKHKDSLEVLVKERTADLGESEERLRHALEAGEFGTWGLDIETGKAWRSLRHDQIFGYTTLLPEWNYQMFLEHVLPEDRKEVDNKFGQALAKSTDWDFECRIKRNDGEIRWIWAQGKPRFDAQKGAVTLIGLVQDITGRKQVAEMLRISNEWLNLAQNAAGTGTWNWDILTGKLSWSEGFYKLFGLPAAAAANFETWLAVLYPDDRRLARENIDLSIKEKLPLYSDYRIVLPDKQVRWINASGKTFYDETGKPVRMCGICMDITERKLTEEALNRERTNLQKIFDLVSVGLLLIDEQGVVRRVNNTVSAWMGKDFSLSPDKQPGNVVGCAHALSDPAGCGDTKHCLTCPIRNTFERVLRTGENAHNIEIQANLLLKGKEADLWFEVSADPITLDGRRNVILSMNDITARKLAEEQLQRINRGLQARSQIDRSVITAENEVEFLKAACQSIIRECGYPLIWIGYAQNDDAKTVRPVASAGFDEGYIENLSVNWSDNEHGLGPTGTAIRTAKPCACTNMLTDPKFAPWRQEAAKRGYASSFVIPLLERSRAFGAVSLYFKQPGLLNTEEARLLIELVDDLTSGIFTIRLRQAHARAISALRDSEERYKGIVFTSPEAILVQSSGKVRFANPAAIEMFKVNNYRQLVDRPILSVVPKDFHKLAKQSIRATLAEQPAGVEMKLLRFDGTVFDAGLTGRSIFFAGKPAVQIIIRDITGIKKAQEILKRDKALLERLVVEKAQELMIAERKFEEAKRLSDIGTLAATVAHELRNPLAAIKMATYNARKKAENPILEKHFANIEIKLHESENIIDNLLFYSKIRTTHFAMINIYNIIGACINDAKARFSMQNISISRKDSAIKDALVEADAVQIREVFANVLNNAFDAVGSEGGVIEIEAQINQEQVKLAFKDNGTGITPEEAQKAFDPFFSTKARGTGLGLAVCKQIINLHNGSIGIQNRPVKGAVVDIVLPLKR